MSFCIFNREFNSKIMTTNVLNKKNSFVPQLSDLSDNYIIINENLTLALNH